VIRTLATVLTATALWVAAAAMAQTRVTEAAYLPDTVASLPTLGRLTGRREAASRGDGVRRPRQRALGAPDVIIASDPAFASAVKTLPGWRDVPAVRAGRIYVPPDLPFGWFDAPPSLNRLLGVQWLVRILHPRLFPEPLGPRVKAFHTLYYHRSPSDAQVRALLDAADVAP